MKLSRIKALCKETGKAIIYTDTAPDGMVLQQYISNGTVIVPVEGLPILQASNLPTLFQLSPAAEEKMTLKDAPLPEGIPVQDMGAWEEAMVPMHLRLKIGRHTLIPLRQEIGRVIYLDADLSGAIEAKEPRYILRKIGTKPVVAIMDGFFLAGIVAPATMPEDSEDDLLAMANAVRIAQAEEPEEETA